VPRYALFSSRERATRQFAASLQAACQRLNCRGPLRPPVPTVTESSAHIEGERGKREIDPTETEAAVVERVFRSFVAGVSPKRIAKDLNCEGVLGLAGAGWSPSTIHGHPSRGTGILNNDLYIGRIVWNVSGTIKTLTPESACRE
jgi:hypothetical protein